MVPATVALDLGSSPEFAGHDNHGRVEHSAVPEVGHQRGNGPIQLICQVSQVSRSSVHRVPVAVGGDLNVANASLDQSSGKKSPLAKGVVSVPVAHSSPVRDDVKRFGHVTGHEFDRLFVKIGIGSHFLMREIMTERGREALGKADSLFQLRFVDGRQQVLDSAGSVADRQRAVVGGKETGARVSACNDDAGGKDRSDLPRNIWAHDPSCG